MYDLEEEITLDKNKKHTIEIVVDRLAIKPDIMTRLEGSLETALGLTGGTALVDVVDGEEMMFSQNFACPDHPNISIDELSPRMFSFNNPFGACEKCTGLGIFMRVDPDLVIPNKNLSIDQGAIKASGWYYADGGVSQMYYNGLAKKYHFSLSTPVKELGKDALKALLYGTNGEKLDLKRESDRGTSTYQTEFEGIIPNLERRFRETNSSWVKEEIAGIMDSIECPECHGARLKPIILAVTVGGINISEFTNMSVRDAVDFMNNLKLTDRENFIAESIIKEIKSRLGIF